MHGTMDSNVVAITGASGALGSELARHLVKKGYRAALLDVPWAAERLKDLGQSLGSGAACTLAVDLSTAEAWKGALAVIGRELGALPSHAVLVAGGWQGGAPLHEEADDSTWRAMIDSNLETVHRSLRALLPDMVAKGRGSIVVIGSRVVERPWTGAGAAAYVAAKSAAVALAQAVAVEVLAQGVRVNAVLPSTLDTPANRRAMPQADPSSWVPLSSAAGVVAFLLSEEARDVSGAALPLYGRVA
jgi:NAD(P)-dependent dehydrogenase (short-subunit alcohol dehydrogenase family)